MLTHIKWGHVYVNALYIGASSRSSSKMAIKSKNSFCRNVNSLGVRIENATVSLCRQCIWFAGTLASSSLYIIVYEFENHFRRKTSTALSRQLSPLLALLSNPIKRPTLLLSTSFSCQVLTCWHISPADITLSKHLCLRPHLLTSCPDHHTQQTPIHLFPDIITGHRQRSQILTSVVETDSMSCVASLLCLGMFLLKSDIVTYIHQMDLRILCWNSGCNVTSVSLCTLHHTQIYSIVH